MEYLVYIVAGFMAGILTGLVGLSAAVVIAPAFATFLGMDPYLAIGIALASDVLASLSGARNYLKERDFDIKRVAILTSVMVTFTIIASYVAYFIPPEITGSYINAVVVILGFRFLLFPIKGKAKEINLNRKRIMIPTLIIGAIIGWISGFFGSGGGLSILALLTMFLGFDMKKAVGTSLFMMAFIALVGAVAHFIIGGTLFVPLIITAFATLLGSYLASLYGSRIKDELLSKLVGIVLLINGFVLVYVYFFVN